jgi:hypothetical protein
MIGGEEIYAILRVGAPLGAEATLKLNPVVVSVLQGTAMP